MRRHIALFHSAKGIIKDIYSAFGRFPKRISDIYEEIETCFENHFGKECVTSGIYQRLFSRSMDRIQRVVDEEFQIMRGFITMTYIYCDIYSNLLEYTHLMNWIQNTF